MVRPLCFAGPIVVKLLPSARLQMLLADVRNQGKTQPPAKTLCFVGTIGVKGLPSAAPPIHIAAELL
jgi:hypothetical protein